jgi:hypothetical protein
LGTARRFLGRSRNSNSRFRVWWIFYTTGLNSNSTEEYDGSAWTGGGNLGTARVFSRLWNANSGISFWWIYNNRFKHRRI